MASLLCKTVVPNLIRTKGYRSPLKQSSVQQLINQESISFWSRVSKTKKCRDHDRCKKPEILVEPSRGEESKCLKKLKTPHPNPRAKLLAFKKVRCVKRRRLLPFRKKSIQAKWNLIKRIFVGKPKETIVKIPDDFQIPEKDPCSVVIGVARCALPPRSKRPLMEVQPVSPAAFKIPKAVLYQIMLKDLEKKQHDCAAQDTEKKEAETSPHPDEDCGALAAAPKEFWLPYDELRPVTPNRRMFTCQKGIRWNDVVRPCTRDSNYCNNLQTYLKAKAECPIHGDDYAEEKLSKAALNTCPSKTCP